MKLIDKAKRTLQREQEAYPCAECGKRSTPGEVHTFLFCQLYKDGWTREQIVANVIYTADELRKAGQS